MAGYYAGSSSFGAGNTDRGGGSFQGASFLWGPRYTTLDRRQSYFSCTQHDYKRYDFDGRVLVTTGATQPLLGTSSSQMVAPYYVPMRERRPSTPYRLSKVIVSSFTNLIFGDDRFPGLRCAGDPDTQDFGSALVKYGGLPARMIRARNLGGSVGTVGLSWCFDAKGKPRYEVHNGKHLYVHEWEDRDLLIPRYVTEAYLYEQEVWNSAKRRLEKKWFWHRRDWSPDGDWLFKPIPYEPQKEPLWEAYEDTERSVQHDDGFAHFVWVQNLPTEEIDGLPDYDGQYEALDDLDVMLSVLSRGGRVNLDPTLVLRMDPQEVGITGVKKGSDNALIVGLEGDAKYLELAGTSLEAGVNLFNSIRRTVLEACDCIVPDPSEIAAQGVSSVALKTIFSSMLGKASILRDQYGTAALRLVEQQVEVARAKMGTRTMVEVTDAATGLVRQEPRILTVNLPPRVERMTVIDETTGKAVTDPTTGEALEEVSMIERKPGIGGDMEWVWPPWFQPTAQDQQISVTTAQLATGGKSVLSQESGVTIAAQAFGIDPGEEWRRVQKMRDADSKEEIEKAKAFAASGDFMGGVVQDPNALPEGAKPLPGKPPEFGQKKPLPEDEEV